MSDFFIEKSLNVVSSCQLKGRFVKSNIVDSKNSFLLNSCYSFEHHEVRENSLHDLKAKGESIEYVLVSNVSVLIYCYSHVVIQTWKCDSEDMVVQRSFCTSNHNNEILLQFDENMEPVRFIKSVIHSVIAICYHRAKILVQEHVCKHILK